MIYLAFVKLYFSSTFNYVQFNHIILDVKDPVLPSAPHVRPPNRQCHAFLQERLQNAVKRSKKAMCDLERARPKNVRPFILEKSGGEVQKKDKLVDFRPPEIKCVSYLCFDSEHTDATLIVTQCA